MLPATKDQCSIRISELLNSFQPWCYYLIWGRVTTCLPPLSLQMFRPLPGLINFMMASKCQSISLIVVRILRSHSAAILCKRIEFIPLKALREAEGYVYARPSSWSSWFLLAHLFHTCSAMNKQTSTSMQLLIKLEPLIFIKSGLWLSSFYYMQWTKALRKDRRKKLIDQRKSCLRVFLSRCE